MTGAFERAHGDVRRFRQGCRCLACRVAHNTYRRLRQSGIGNPRFPDPSELVDTTAARAHLEELQDQGVGYRQAATLAGVSEPLVLKVRTGRVTQIRADTQARILSAPAVLAHGQRITGWRTWRLLDSLLGEGYTHRQVAAFLGHPSGLQIGRKHCTVRSALDVRALYRHLNREGDDPAPDRTHVTETTLPASRARPRRPGAHQTSEGRGHRQVGGAAHAG